MTAGPNQSGQRESAFERRFLRRTEISKGAFLFFSGQIGVRSCHVTDITNVGAGLCIQDLPALPLKFELSFDNFCSLQQCRLIWRDRDFLGVMFEK